MSESMSYTYIYKYLGLGCVKIERSDGKSCFLQGEEGYTFLNRLDRCHDSGEEQSVMSEYDSLIIFD